MILINSNDEAYRDQSIDPHCLATDWSPGENESLPKEIFD